MNPLTNIIIIFPLAITLHNIEEALWLPQWSRHAGRFHKPVEKNEFYFALICITILAYLSSFLYIFFPYSLLIKYAYFGFTGSMIVNAIVPHFAAAVVLKKYAPGLITGLFLIIPCNSLIIYFAVNNGIITIFEIIISIVITGGILLMLLPVFFKIGCNITAF